MGENEKITTEGRDLGFWGLTAVAVGMTVASGVFSLPRDFPEGGASQGAVLIGWLVCGLGMFGLMRTFFGLSYVKPELKGGIFSFARAGFGDWVGFLSAWGYWVCCWVCLVAFSNLLFAASGYFFPFLGTDGNSIPAIICASIFLWILCALTLKGVDTASIVNVIVTFAKMVPLFLFIILAFLMGKFNPEIFFDNFWGTEGAEATSILAQVAGTAMITLWVFSGIEGAVVVSQRAKKMSDVAKASAASFFFVLVLYMFISLVSMGIMPGEDLAELGNPSLAYVMEAVVGPWGAVLINLGVMVSLAGGLLAVVIITAEVANSAAKNGSFCKFFAKENKNGSPVNSLVLSIGLAQLLLITTYFGETTFQALYWLSASMLMLPYLFCALYYAKVVMAKEGFDLYPGCKYGFEVFVAAIAVLYGLWLVVAVSFEYLLYSCMFYAPGALVYLKGRKEQNLDVFPGVPNKVLAAVVIIAGIISLVLIINGTLQPL